MVSYLTKNKSSAKHYLFLLESSSMLRSFEMEHSSVANNVTFNTVLQAATKVSSPFSRVKRSVGPAVLVDVAAPPMARQARSSIVTTTL